MDSQHSELGDTSPSAALVVPAQAATVHNFKKMSDEEWLALPSADQDALFKRLLDAAFDVDEALARAICVEHLQKAWNRKAPV